jgi:hypothetical protein
MLPDERTQEILAGKDTEAALASCKRHGYAEGWRVVDGAVVVYNLDAPPAWLPKVSADG